jgi:hypothetical protein
MLTTFRRAPQPYRGARASGLAPVVGAAVPLSRDTMSLTKTSSKTIVACFSLILIGTLAAAERDIFIHGPKDKNSNYQEGEAWKEQAAANLPPWPKDADLVEFHTSNHGTPFRHYIDTKSLSVDAQQIVRYTVVVESGSGGRNVAYEGIRCTPNGEHRTYAYGASGTFQPVPDSPWRGVQDPAVPPYAPDLEQFFLCVPLKFEPRPVKEMPRILSGRGKARDSSGFLTD